MRKSLILVLCLALLLCGCGANTYRPVKRIRESGELLVALRVTGQPFVSGQSGAYQGIEISFVESLARELGVQAVYTEYATAGEVLDAVRYGSADIAVGRLSGDWLVSAGVGFTLELGQEAPCLVSRSPAVYDTLGSVEGKPIGLVEGTAAADLIQWNLEADLDWLWYPSLEAGVSGLLEGDIVAVACTEAEAASVMQLADGQLAAAGLVNGERGHYSAVLAADNTGLMELANSLIQAPHLEQQEAQADEAAQSGE